MTSSFDEQIGGDHYKKLAMQPVQIGEIFGGDWCIVKVMKYLLRDKGTKAQDWDKAQDCLNMKAEIQREKNEYTKRPIVSNGDLFDIIEYVTCEIDLPILEAELVGFLLDLFLGHYGSASQKFKKLHKNLIENNVLKG